MRASVRARTAYLREANPASQIPIPIDLVTASASGLDPHISPPAAAFQVPRVARARGLAEPAVAALVAEHVEGATTIFGAPRVNVLLLNLALDRISAPGPSLGAAEVRDRDRPPER